MNLNIKKLQLLLVHKSLQWLSGQCSIGLKALHGKIYNLLMHKSLNGVESKYMSDLLVLLKPIKALISAGSNQLAEPGVRTKQVKSTFSCYSMSSDVLQLLQHLYSNSNWIVSCSWCFKVQSAAISPFYLIYFVCFWFSSFSFDLPVCCSSFWISINHLELLLWM